MEWRAFSTTLAEFVKVSDVKPSDVLFRNGLNIPSIVFTEFIMEIEEQTGMDIDLRTLDESIVTAGQLYERIFEKSAR